MPNHSYSYEAVLADSHKINWKVEDLIGGDKRLDFSRPFMPERLAGVSGIQCLNPREKRLLNQIRGNSYLYLFSFVEEFILPFALGQAKDAVHGDPLESHALTVLAEEEAKHIHLFKSFAKAFKEGFNTHCDVIGPASEVSKAILAHSELGVAIAILMIEWMSQAHFLDAVKDDQDLDPHFKSLLKHHWQEESQHAKTDTLIVEKLAKKADAATLARAFEDYAKIGAMLEGGLHQQIELDMAALERAAGRKLGDIEKAEIRTAQLKAYRYTFLGSGMVHPNFVRTVRELSPAAADDVAKMAVALS
jgi:hypothetical protein